MTDQLLDDCVGGGHNITHTVDVECYAFFSADAEPVMAPLGEIQNAQGVAAQCASGTYGDFRGAAGIVGAVDFRTDVREYGIDGVESMLLACKAASPNYRGVRQSCAYDEHLTTQMLFSPPPDHPAYSLRIKPGLYLEPEFREGFALLAKHDLSFDAGLFSSQLPELLDLAKAFPDTTIILNHLGSPVAMLGDWAGAPAYDGKQKEIEAKWKEDMARIAAECPNVNVKVGGHGMPNAGSGFDAGDKPPGSEEVAAAFQESYMWTVETFGPSRCMFESNFPVDKVSMSYTVLWNALKRMTAGLPDEDRALLFSGTAKRVYRL